MWGSIDDKQQAAGVESEEEGVGEGKENKKWGVEKKKQYSFIPGVHGLSMWDDGGERGMGGDLVATGGTLIWGTEYELGGGGMV